MKRSTLYNFSPPFVVIGNQVSYAAIWNTALLRSFRPRFQLWRQHSANSRIYQVWYHGSCYLAWKCLTGTRLLIHISSTWSPRIGVIHISITWSTRIGIACTLKPSEDVYNVFNANIVWHAQYTGSHGCCIDDQSKQSCKVRNHHHVSKVSAQLCHNVQTSNEESRPVSLHKITVSRYKKVAVPLALSTAPLFQPHQLSFTALHSKRSPGVCLTDGMGPI